MRVAHSTSRARYRRAVPVWTLPNTSTLLLILFYEPYTPLMCLCYTVVVGSMERNVTITLIVTITNILLLNSIGLESFEKEVSNCERKKIDGGHCTGKLVCMFFCAKPLFTKKYARHLRISFVKLTNKLLYRICKNYFYITVVWVYGTLGTH